MSQKIKLSAEKITEEILLAYERIGQKGSKPPAGMKFSTGRELALELGYPVEVIDMIEEEALEGFVGAHDLPREILADGGDLVVADCGCGAGVDSLWLSSGGARVVSLDLSPGMLSRLKTSLRKGAGAKRVFPALAMLPDFPVRDGIFTHALMNGVANLVPDKERLLSELHRVLKGGGKALVADLLVLGEVDDAIREDPASWAWCVGGALSPAEWSSLGESAGFGSVEVDVLEEFDPLGRGVVRLKKQ